MCKKTRRELGSITLGNWRKMIQMETEGDEEINLHIN